MSIFDHPIISERYFFPRHAPPSDPTTVQVEGAELACIYRDWAAKKLLLHFHGNGEVAQDWTGPVWQHADANVFLAEYRGYGGSTGVAQLARMLDDVEAILEATGVAPENVIAFGRSVGSIYAIHLAHRVPTLGGLIIESGIASVLERLLVRMEPAELGVTLQEMQAEHDRLFDHEAKLRAYPGPTLVLHTRHDHMVELSHAERNAAWSGGRLVVFDEGDHNTIWAFNGQSIIEEIAGFTLE